MLFTETTTIGVRYQEMMREWLEREIVRWKRRSARYDSRWPVATDSVLNAAPEFDDCARVAAEHGLPLKEVQAMALSRLDAAMKPMNPFYITTPIYYINAEPHLGHAYTTMVADAIARSRRLMGDDVFFLTGTDEHGQKVERAAQKAGIDTHAFADRIAAEIPRAVRGARTSRTTISSARPSRGTSGRRRRSGGACGIAGYLYKAAYEGWYCTVDELFVPEAQLVDGRCPTCGNRSNA